MSAEQTDDARLRDLREFEAYEAKHEAYKLRLARERHMNTPEMQTLHALERLIPLIERLLQVLDADAPD